jgi:hypothetical protein
MKMTPFSSKYFRLTPLWSLATGIVIGCSHGPALAIKQSEKLIDFKVAQGDKLPDLSPTYFSHPAAWQEVARLNHVAEPYQFQQAQTLKVPLRLLKSFPIEAKLISVQGNVQINHTPVRSGIGFSEGQRLETQSKSSAVIELADGSRAKLPPSSVAEIIFSKRFPTQSAAVTAAASDPFTTSAAQQAADSTGLFEGTLRLIRGSIEIFASKVLRAKPLEVTTPTAVVGVRGTHYRVGHTADERVTQDTTSFAEVLEGNVHLDTVAGHQPTTGRPIPEGYAISADATRKPLQLVKLPEPPELSNAPKLFELPVARISFIDEKNILRVQVASDAAFDKIVQDDLLSAGSEWRTTELEDGLWYIRARRVTDEGISGKDSPAHAFTINARPQPPIVLSSRLPQTSDTVLFTWAENMEAARYQLQLATDANFQQLKMNQTHLIGNHLILENVPSGRYHGRMASLDAEGKTGPFGPTFMLDIPAQGSASEKISVTQSDIYSLSQSWSFAWKARSEDKQRVELANDAKFINLVKAVELNSPAWDLDTTSQDIYFFRHTSIEPNGRTAPTSAVYQFNFTLPLKNKKEWKEVGIEKE